MKRYLIVNADDFGLSFGVNQGIIEAFEHGIVTSTSLMVNWIGAEEAAAYARKHPNLSLGLHLDLGEWAYRDGEWVTLYEEVPLDDATVVADEVARQLASFRFFLGKDPTHIDSHQHVHREEPAQSVVTTIARELSIPLRHFNSSVSYCGNFYGQMAEGEGQCVGHVGWFRHCGQPELALNGLLHLTLGRATVAGENGDECVVLGLKAFPRLHQFQRKLRRDRVGRCRQSDQRHAHHRRR